MQKVKIDDIIEFARNGASIKQSEGAKGFPISRIETIWNSTIDENRLGYANIFDEDLIKYEKYLLKENDILITHINSPKHLGKSAIYTGYPEKLIHGMNLLCLRNNPNLSNSKYLFYYFQTRYFKNQILKISNQSVNQASFAVTNLKDLEIPLPPLPTQQKIATILDKADELRQYNQQLIEKYDALTQSLFLDMFGDPVRNEKGWNKIELKKFGKIITGNTPSRNDKENYSSDFIEWLKTDNISDKYVNVTQAKEYLSEKGFCKARFVENGALLVACIAGSIESIGRTSLTDRKVSFNQQINAIQPFDDVNSKFLYYLFKISKKHIQNHASNGMKRMLTKGEFEKILMIKPALDLQNQFAEKVQLIEIQKQQVQEALEKSEDLFQSLLQLAFKGELN